MAADSDYDIARWIEGAAGDVLQVEEGTLYPALHRLEAKGWLDASWGSSDSNRRAKYYRLTTAGRAASLRAAQLGKNYDRRLCRAQRTAARFLRLP